MGKTLYISEKPSVGREIAKVLGEELKPQEGYLEGPEDIVTWARGHLFSLAPPDVYNPRYKRWRIEDLPIVPTRFRLQPVRGAGGQISLLKRLLKRADVDIVVNACDAGREGELIFAWILDYCAPKNPAYTIERLWLSSLTENAIREALGHRRTGKETASLEKAARARAAADWVVGINGTRASSIRFRPVFDSSASVGRVQTPTLAILARREAEIAAFQAKPRFTVEVSFEDMGGTSYVGRWRGAAMSEVSEQNIEKTAEDPEEVGGEEQLIDEEEEEEGKEQEFLPSRADAERVKLEVMASEPQTRVLFELSDEEVKEAPPLPYDLTALQREVNKKWKQSAQKTLDQVQTLYERYKAVTYPRTDSRYLSTDIKEEMPALFASLAAYPSYATLAQPLVQQGQQLVHPARPFADDKISDHHAILPTAEPTFKGFFVDQGSDPEEALPPELFRVYDLIVRRTLALYYPDAISRRLRVRTNTGERAKRHIFLTTGKGLVVPGWREVYGRKPQPDKVPNLLRGPVQIKEVCVVESETKPPKRYSEGTLLQAMETAGRFIKDKELREAMKSRGLGTPATRAQIIERLLDVGYLKRQRGELHVTDKGRQLIGFLGGSLIAQPNLTGDWEARLHAIEEGKGDVRGFWQGIVGFTRQVLSEIESVHIPEEILKKAKQEDLGPALGICPHCGDPIRKTPKAWSCWRSQEEPGCGFAIWQEISGRKLSDEEALSLIKEGHVGPLDGFERSGQMFAATLVIKRMPGGAHAVTFELLSKG